ncbi:hypothetical protein BC834DRAFT_971821 [Gloeopeniophorella convolvens]|nr:hypothetical protein BC834DRAFT_971821 [Gloeopeniophorella convolvens]
MPSPFFNFPSPPPGEQQTVPFPRRRGGVAAAPVYAQLKAEKEQLKADKGQVRNKQHDPNSGKKDASKSTTIDDPGAPTDSTAADPNVLFQQILDGMASGDPGIADLDLASLFPSPEDWQSVVGTSVDTTPASSSTPASHPRAISTAPPAKDAASTSSATPAPGAVPAVDATPSVPTPTPNIVARPYATPGSFPVDDAVPLTSTPPSLTAAPAPQSTMMALPLPRPQRTLSEYIFPSFSQAMQSFNFTGTDGPQAQRTLMGPGVPPAGVNHTQRTMPPTGPPRKMTPVYNYPMFNSTKIWRPYGEPGPDPDPDPEPIRLGKRKQEATQSSVELPSFRTLGPGAERPALRASSNPTADASIE